MEYDVDGAGRRVGRRVLDASGVELEYRGWVYRDLLRPVAEVDAFGNVVARYVYADGEGGRQNGVSQLLTRLGANQDTSLPFSGKKVPETIELLDASGAASQTLHLTTNQVGTVELVTDAATGAVVERIESDEFGRVLYDSSPGLQPFGFAGGLLDSLTGLVRFGARDYAPDVGRWTARDPILFAGGQTNLYVYIGNEPVNFVDPEGNWAWVAGTAAVGFAVGLGTELYSNGGSFSAVDWGHVAKTTALGAAAGVGASFIVGGSLFGGVATAGGLVQVTQWGPGNSRWVELGGNTFRNHVMSGAVERYARGSGVTRFVDPNKLQWPTGLERVKGIFGQRIMCE